ncbi:MAG: hypothetical protein ACREL5_08010 [Gemmatimonadales bacterium]
MSRAFVRDDGDAEPPTRVYRLPPRDDPTYDREAATALLEAARVGDIASAEEATGYAWGAPELRKHVDAALAQAERKGDDRLAQVAERFLAARRGPLKE